MSAQRFLTIVMAALLADSSSLARPVVLGVVVEANRVHLNAGVVTEGATVYDGDRFSTETGGVLVLRGEGSLLELTAESEMLVRRSANGMQGTQADLHKGTLAFRAEGAAALEIVSEGAAILPLPERQTVGMVSVVGPRELRVTARQGELQFSYREETKTIAEGAAYRVILDPVDNDPQKEGPVKARRQKRNFLLIAISSGAVGAAVGVYESRRHKKVESPDRP